MATTNFKLFDENKANLLSDTEYANATQRLNGVQTGVASSQLNNKFAYQVSLVAYAIAQLMNANGLDANDTASVSAFVGNLQGSILQKVADMASSTEAVAGVLTNKYISPATMKAAALMLSGGTMSGILDMNGNRITNLPTPTANSDPATKEYVDGKDNSGWVLQGSVNTTVSSYNMGPQITGLDVTNPVRYMKIVGTINAKKDSFYKQVYILGLNLVLSSFGNSNSYTTKVNIIVPVYDLWMILSGPQYKKYIALVGANYTTSSVSSLPFNCIYDTMTFKCYTNSGDTSDCMLNLSVYYKFWE